MGRWSLIFLQGGIDQGISPIGQQLIAHINTWRESIIGNIPKIIIASVVLGIALVLDDRVQRAVERIVGLDADRRELARLLGRVARYGVLVAAVVIILGIFQQTAIVASFIASLGIAGLVIAFALQDITKNFAAGVLLLILRPFRLDDYIKVRDFEGTVTDISLRATALRTSDGTQVLVPNADVYISTITNLTHYHRRRHHVSLQVPAALPLQSVQQRLLAALHDMPELGEEAAPGIVATALEAGEVTLDVRFWLPSHTPDEAEHISAVIERLRDLALQFKAEAQLADAVPDSDGVADES